MKQKWIKIGEVDVPIVIDDNKEWFPVSYLSKKLLLRDNVISKHNKNKYMNKLKKYIIKFSENNIQESNCINKEGLIQLLKHTQVARLSSEQRKSQNQLHKFLGINILPEDEIDTHTYNNEWFNQLDEYTKDVIKTEIKNEDVEWFRMCSNCHKHFPLTNRFYSIDYRSNKGFSKICKVCRGFINHFNHQDSDKQVLMKQNEDLYLALNNDYLPKIIDAYLNKEIKKIPDCYKNKNDYLRIIDYLYTNKHIDKENLTINILINKFKLNSISNYLSIEDIYSYLFGDDFYYYTWKFPKFSFRSIKLTDEIGIKIVQNYLKEKNIIIDNIFTYNYEELFRKCRIRGLTHDVLGLIVKYYNHEYAGYLFKTNAVNYYKNEDNLLFDLKYLVEQDMKIEIDKIPLYLTKYTLQKKSLSLYNFIITKKNGSLYEWFDRLYPNKFTLYDFEMNAYRNEFDSDKELYIHEILTSNFKNVIYNQKHTDRTIVLDGMIPDWLVITEQGVCIIEYFGLYEERQYGKSSRVTDYIDKTKRKIEKYKNMTGYKFIFLYPNDIEDDFKGTRNIVAKMKINPYMTMV